MNFLPPAHDLVLFVTAAIVLLLIPGPAVLYIVARSVDRGRMGGVASSSGIAVGTLVQVSAATFGLSALLLSSAAAYSLVKSIGKSKFRVRGEREFYGVNGVLWRVRLERVG